MDRHRNGARRGSLWISIISVLLIVGAVAAALAAMQHLPMAGPGFAGQGALSDDVTLDISYVAGLSQPEGVWFTPDGSRIATLGVFTPCPITPHQLPACDHGLAIIDPHTDKLDRISPIEPLLGIQADTSNGAEGEFVSLYGLGWTPDSAWFGMIFSVFSSPKPQTPNDLLDSGLLLVNPSSGQVNLLRGDSGYFTSLGDLAADHPIWDTQQRTEQSAAPLVPGLAYTWATSTAPQPLDPARAPLTKLPAFADSFAPVGNPDAISLFTAWQPGVLIGPGSFGLSGQRSALITTFPAWSNTSTRVGVFTLGVSLPTPDSAFSVVSAPASVGSPHVTPPDSFIVAPARDPALTSVQNRIGAYGWAMIAWKPDGSALASVNCFSRLGETLEVRETLSGALIGQRELSMSSEDPGCRDLQQAQKLGAYPHPNLSISWSPDGRQLALMDAIADTITTWRYSSSE
jgi:hypothetical protein